MKNRSVILAILIALSFGLHAAEGVWVPIAGVVGGFDHEVRGLAAWRGDMIAVGSFTAIGSTTVDGIARWDGSAWSGLPGAAEHAYGPFSDASERFSHVAVWGDDLVVARNTLADPEVEPIWRFDGEHWTALASFPMGSHDQIDGLRVATGCIYVLRRNDDGSSVLRWDGAVWHELPLGGLATGVATYGDQAYVAGSALTLDGQPADIVTWDGTSATAIVGRPSTNTSAETYAETPKLVCDPATGVLWTATHGGLASWDGSTWTVVHGDVDEPLTLECRDGLVLVGGRLSSTAGEDPVTLSSYEIGTATWHEMGRSDLHVKVIAFRGEELWAGGLFSGMSGIPAGHVAVFDGSAWSSPAQPGTSGSVTCCAWYDGSLYVGGRFSSVGGEPAHNLARWDGLGWHDEHAASQVSSMTTDGMGRLWVLSDDLQSVGGVAVHNVAYRDADGWHAAGELVGSLDGVYPDGNTVVVCGAIWKPDGLSYAMAARWTGSEWAYLGEQPGYGGAAAAIRTHEGNLMVVGNFNMAPGGPSTVAVLKDGGWQQLGSGLTCDDSGAPVALSELPDSRMLVVGRLQVHGVFAYAAVWNGLVWSASEGIYDPVRILAWHDRTLLVRSGGPVVYELVGNEWLERAFEGDQGAKDAVIGDDRIFMVGSIGTIDGRRCAGVVALDLVPPTAPEVTVHVDGDGSVDISMPSGNYDVRPVEGDWQPLGTATSATLSPIAPLAPARRLLKPSSVPASADGWELQRIDGQTEFSAKIRIRSNGTVVVPSTGFEESGTTARSTGESSGSGSGCGVGGMSGAGMAGLILALGIRRRRLPRTPVR